MPPTQPQLNPRAMKQQLRQLNPTFLGTDDELYSAWLVQNPQYRSAGAGKEVIAGQALEDPTWFSQAVTTGARIGPAVIGSILGSPGGIPGIMAGGAAGSAIGETMAQGIEQYLGQREGYNPWSIGIATGMGAVPGAGKLPALAGKSLPAVQQILSQRVRKEALKGASTATLGDVGFQLSETGEWNPMQTFLAGGIGGLAGGGLQSLSQRGIAKQQATVGVLKLDQMEKDFEKALVTSMRTPGETLEAATTRFREGFIDKEFGYKSFVQKLAHGDSAELRKGGVGWGDGSEFSPTVAADIAGGTGAKVEGAVDQMRDIFHRIWQRDMAADVNRLLTLKGFRRGFEDYNHKLKKALEHDAKHGLAGTPQATADPLQQKMLEGKVLPQGYTEKEVLDDLRKVKAGLISSGRWEEVNAFADEIVHFNRESLMLMQHYQLISAKTANALRNVQPQLSKLQRKKLGLEALDYEQYGGRRDKYGEKALREHIPLFRFMDAIGEDIGDLDETAAAVAREIGERVQKGKTGSWKFDPFGGSAKAVVPPMESSLRARRGLVIAGEDNMRKLALVNFVEADFQKGSPKIGPKVQDHMRLKKHFVNLTKENKKLSDLPGQGYDWETFTVLKDGNRQTWAAPEAIVASINHLDEAGSAMLGEVAMNFGARLTARFATSLNVGFSITNVLRDNMDLVMMRKVVHNPVQFAGYLTEWGKTLVQVIRQELTHGARAGARAIPFGLGRKFGKLPIPAYKQEVVDWSTGKTGLVDLQQEMVDAGGAFSGLQRQISPGEYIGGSAMEEGGSAMTNNLLSGIDTVLSPFARFSGALEDTTKIAAYKTLRKQGVSPREAAWLTRKFGGSPDFAVRGRYARHAGSMVLFFNAQMQGIVRNAAVLKDLKKDKWAFTQMMMGATGLELLRTQWNSRYTDPDGTPSADRMTTSDRENYWTWVLPETEVIQGVPRHKMLKFSKGHLARIIFNPIADVLHAAHSEREQWSPTQTTLNLFEQFSPGSINLEPGRMGESFLDGLVSSSTPLIKTPIELAWNRRTFSGTPIESMGQQQRSPSYRARADTSPLFKHGAAMLRETTGIEASPVLGEYAMRSIIPGLGEQVTKAGDVILGGGSIPGAVGASLVEPVLRRFKGSRGDQVLRDLSTKFYRAVDRTRKAHADLRSLQVNEPGKAQAFVNKHQTLLQYRLPLQRIQTQLGRLQQLPDEQSAPVIRQLLENAATIIDRMKNDG